MGGKAVDRAGAQDRAAEAWTAAQGYARHLAAGRPPGQTFVNGILLQPDETAVFETTATYERFWGGDGAYTRSGSFFLGSPAFVVAGLAGTALANSVRKGRAARDAVPSWRERQEARVVATNRRLLTLLPGRGFLSFWWEGTQEFYPAPRSWAMVLVWPEVAPLRLSGLSAPYLCVHAGAALLPGRWTQHPLLAELVGPQDAR